MKLHDSKSVGVLEPFGIGNVNNNAITKREQKRASQNGDKINKLLVTEILNRKIREDARRYTCKAE